MNGNSQDSFFDFPHDKDLLEYEIYIADDKKKYDISFYPVEQFDVNYYVKAVYRDTKIPGEREDTIAISESEGFYLQIDRPEFDFEGKEHLTFQIPDNNREIAYVKILAKVNFYSIKEFLLYKPIDIHEDDIRPNVDYDEINPTEDVIDKTYNATSNQVKLNVRGAFRIQRYKIKFNNANEIPNFIKIQTISKDTKNQILYFSPTDADGIENRLQIGQKGDGANVTMWITKEQFENNKFFYTTVECQVKDGGRCNYEVDFIGYKYISIDSCIFTYNYYVSAKNKKMTFAINNDIGISSTSDQILTLYANGGKKIKLTLGNCIGDTCKQYDFRTGAAITTKIQKHNFFELTVEAEEGDYISVGSKVTLPDGKSYENDLKPNNYQLTGYLKKGVLDRECYSIPDKYDDISYIVGMFYNNAAEIYFNDQNFNEIAGTKETITKGYYSYVHYHKKSPFNLRKYICVRFPDSNNYINENLVYSLQLTQPTEKVGLLNIYGPQLKGNIYPRIIPRGSTVFFNGANLNSNKKMNELLYNMIALEGLPIMYIYKCQNYPKCDFDFDDDDVIKINEINRMSTWHTTFFNNSITPIDAEQYIMIVKCEDLENSATDVCQFQTSIYENEDEIYLIDRQPVSQYIRQEEKSKYIIDLTLEKSSTKVHVDIFVLSGDVNFKLKDENNKDIVSHKYYLANKIFHSINLEENRGIKKNNS